MTPSLVEILGVGQGPPVHRHRVSPLDRLHCKLLRSPRHDGMFRVIPTVVVTPWTASTIVRLLSAEDTWEEIGNLEGRKEFFPTASTAVPSRSRRSRNIRRALEVVEVIVIAVVVAVVVIIKWCCVWRDNGCCADEIAKMVIRVLLFRTHREHLSQTAATRSLA